MTKRINKNKFLKSKFNYSERQVRWIWFEFDELLIDQEWIESENELYLHFEHNSECFFHLVIWLFRDSQLRNQLHQLDQYKNSKKKCQTIFCLRIKYVGSPTNAIVGRFSIRIFLISKARAVNGLFWIGVLLWKTSIRYSPVINDDYFRINWEIKSLTDTIGRVSYFVSIRFEFRNSSEDEILVRS